MPKRERNSLGYLTAPIPYLSLPGTTGEALAFYASVFGGSADLHTYADFGRTDGPADAVAHGSLTGGPVALFASDAAGVEPVFRSEGLMLSILGAADPTTLRQWFTQLAEGGTIADELERRSWGASDGQVIDRFGVHWLIGFEDPGG